MNQTLPLAQWLSASRANETPIAWLDEHIWTLGQLRHDVAAQVSILQQHEGDRWALCFENSYLFIVGLLATLHAGKTPVVPGHSRVSLLEEQRALFNGVLTDQALTWSGSLIQVQSAYQSSENPPPLPTLDPASHIELFTSGSTGRPRRIIKPIASLDREASLLAERFADRLTGCHIVASVPPLHLYGLTFRIFLPMALGLPLHAAMLHYTEQLATLANHHQYAFISSPAFLKRLDHQLAPPPVNMVISAGGVLRWENVAQTASWLGVWPDEIYGSTETGILAWRHHQQPDVTWQPFPGVRIMVDADEIRAISPLISDRHGLLLDDILQFDDSGRFQITGRRDRVVKIEEKRISLCEIEQRLLELEGIREAAALPVTRGGRQGIGALLVLEDHARQQWQKMGGKALEISWRRALRPWLEPVTIPRYWRIVDEMPVNSMNKRVYAQLQELFHETP
ncbi:AMP-binding protein [Serratia sp. 14-2641]|uniref:AMP-binding protein n=1 Tax=Serratia sp. 14-2641 TaxID=1841657 RepID=UPI00080FD4EE|nr:AMP-binding protein [Serratia sp. 14-2641]OCJ46333.1 AMP-dependent synthetase [Serratia sp. 14-2641]